MSVRIAALGLCVAVSLAGCTVMEMRKDVEQREARLQVKQSELDQAEQQQTALKQRQSALIADLESRQMTLDDLQARLDQLKAENDRASATTGEQRARQRDLDSKIAQQRLAIERQKQEIAMLERKNALSADEKRKRIDYLKSEIRRQLELQL